MDENGSRPISALQIVLKFKKRIPSTICIQSLHASNLSNRHYLGNLTGKTYLKKITTGSEYTRNRDVLVIVEFRGRLVSTADRTKDPSDGFRCIF